MTPSDITVRIPINSSRFTIMCGMHSYSLSYRTSRIDLAYSTVIFKSFSYGLL